MSAFFDEIRQTLRVLGRQNEFDHEDPIGWVLNTGGMLGSGGAIKSEELEQQTYSMQCHPTAQALALYDALICNNVHDKTAEKFASTARTSNAFMTFPRVPVRSTEVVLERLQKFIEEGWKKTSDGKGWLLLPSEEQPRPVYSFHPEQFLPVLDEELANRNISAVETKMTRYGQEETVLGVFATEEGLQKIEAILDISIDRGQGQSR